MAASGATINRRSALTPARQEQEPSKRNQTTNQLEALQNAADAPDRSSKRTRFSCAAHLNLAQAGQVYCVRLRPKRMDQAPPTLPP
jgi:hypothetical protein